MEVVTSSRKETILSKLFCVFYFVQFIEVCIFATYIIHHIIQINRTFYKQLTKIICKQEFIFYLFFSCCAFLLWLCHDLFSRMELQSQVVFIVN